MTRRLDIDIDINRVPRLDPAAQAAFADLNDRITSLTRSASRAISQVEERQARQEIRRRLPRAGAWLIEHPRILRLVFRLRPRLRPVLVRHQGELIGRIV